MKYINDIIKSGGTKGIKVSKGKTLEQLLLEQAYYLQELIEKYLRDYRKAFTPKRYRRTGSLENSVRVSVARSVNSTYTVYVYFDENAAHRSGFGAWAVKDGRGKYDDDVNDYNSENAANTALLVNDGYVVSKPVWFKDYHNFGFREGAHFVEKAIEEFNSTNSLGIKVNSSDVIRGLREW